MSNTKHANVVIVGAGSAGISVASRLLRSASYVSDLLADTSSVEYLLEGMNDVVPIQKGMDIIQETNERFKEDESKSNMSILQMYRLLKDPTVKRDLNM